MNQTRCDRLPTSPITLQAVGYQLEKKKLKGEKAAHYRRNQRILEFIFAVQIQLTNSASSGLNTKSLLQLYHASKSKKETCEIIYQTDNINQKTFFTVKLGPLLQSFVGLHVLYEIVLFQNHLKPKISNKNIFQSFKSF